MRASDRDTHLGAPPLLVWKRIADTHVGALLHLFVHLVSGKKMEEMLENTQTYSPIQTAMDRLRQVGTVSSKKMVESKLTLLVSIEVLAPSRPLNTRAPCTTYSLHLAGAAWPRGRGAKERPLRRPLRGASSHLKPSRLTRRTTNMQLASWKRFTSGEPKQAATSGRTGESSIPWIRRSMGSKTGSVHTLCEVNPGESGLIKHDQGRPKYQFHTRRRRRFSAGWWVWIRWSLDWSNGPHCFILQ